MILLSVFLLLVFAGASFLLFALGVGWTALHREAPWGVVGEFWLGWFASGIPGSAGVVAAIYIPFFWIVEDKSPSSSVRLGMGIGGSLTILAAVVILRLGRRASRLAQSAPKGTRAARFSSRAHQQVTYLATLMIIVGVSAAALALISGYWSNG